MHLEASRGEVGWYKKHVFLLPCCNFAIDPKSRNQCLFIRITNIDPYPVLFVDFFLFIKY